MSTSFHPDEVTPAKSSAKTPTMLKQGGEALAQDGSTEPGAAKPVVAGMLRPFKVRNFNLLFSGQTVSIIGDALYMVALPWLILTTGGSAEVLGIVLAAYGIPRAGSMLVGGWLSDRLRPRRLMLIADSARLLLVGLLAALALGGHPTVFQLCVIAVPLRAFAGAFLPASMSILPDTLGNEDLQAGNGLMMSSMQGANLVGSALAGVVVATFIAGAGLAIDAATFLVSAVSLALMRTAHRATPGTRGEGESREHPSTSTQQQGAQVGDQGFWHFLLTSRLIQVILLMFIVIGLVSGGLIEVALPTLVHGPMHGGRAAMASSWRPGVRARSLGASPPACWANRNTKG